MNVQHLVGFCGKNAKVNKIPFTHDLINKPLFSVLQWYFSDFFKHIKKLPFKKQFSLSYNINHAENLSSAQFHLWLNKKKVEIQDLRSDMNLMHVSTFLILAFHLSSKYYFLKEIKRQIRLGLLATILVR